MFKKILVISTILFSSISIANADPAPYVGASIGITNNTSSVKYDLSNLATYNTFGGSYRGMPVNIFIGYGGVITQCFYLGGELFGTLGTFDLTDDTGLKTSYGFGLAIIPGLMLSDQTLAYLRFGILRAKFSRAEEMSNAGQFGLGLQTIVTQNVDLRVEYDYVAYRSVSALINNSELSVTPRSDQFSVSLIYKFD